MALSASAIKADIKSTLEGQGFVFNDVSRLDELITAISDVIVNHIKTTGVVNTVVTGSCPNGAVTGTGVGTLT